MKYIDDLKIRTKLIGIIILVMIGFSTFGIITYYSLNTLQTNKAMGEGKDLVADILPPPEYIIESDLNAYQMINAIQNKADQATVDKLISHGNQLEKEYEDRHVFWEKKLSEGELKNKITVTSYKPAKSFYKIRNEQFIPLIQARDTERAISVLNTLMQPQYDLHRAEIDSAVVLADTRNNRLEKESSDLVSYALFLMLLAGIIIGIILIGYIILISRSITGPLNLVLQNLKKLSKGVVNTRLQLSRKDEIGEMAVTMDKYSDGLQKFVVMGMKKIAGGDLTVNIMVQDEEDEIAPALNTINTTLKALIAESDNLSKAALAGQLSTRGREDIFTGGYRGIISGVNATLNSVVGPVNEAMRVSGEYARYNFIARVDENLDVQGDFVRFKDALNQIGIQGNNAIGCVKNEIESLSAVMEETNARAEEVTSNINTLTQCSDIVSVFAERSGSGIRQTLTVMEDLSNTISCVAAKAEQASVMAKQTVDISEKGVSLAGNAEKGMEEIIQSVDETNEIISGITGQMEEIGKIVDVITGIAEQTGLLALNAAIEAARAGDAGRGFAVVAEEVKALAHESQSSAENIATIIGNLQKKSRLVSDSMKGSASSVKAGNAAVSETLKVFKQIVDAINAVHKNMAEIAGATQEQAAAVEEITASVNEVGSMVQQTARKAIDSAAVTNEVTTSINQITLAVSEAATSIQKISAEMVRFKTT